MNFCKDCKFFHNAEPEPICTAVTRVDPVFGHPQPQLCSVQRASWASGYCGPIGAFFESALPDATTKEETKS